jgi:hypothetical protein
VRGGQSKVWALVGPSAAGVLGRVVGRGPRSTEHSWPEPGRDLDFPRQARFTHPTPRAGGRRDLCSPRIARPTVHKRRGPFRVLRCPRRPAARAHLRRSALPVRLSGHTRCRCSRCRCSRCRCRCRCSMSMFDVDVDVRCRCFRCRCRRRCRCSMFDVDSTRRSRASSRTDEGGCVWPGHPAPAWCGSSAE